MPEQQIKRRRVTRACDECRKKKVKCDGQQPCIHCTVYAYECTYNQPSKRSSSHTSSTTNVSNQTNNITNSSSSKLRIESTQSPTIENNVNAPIVQQTEITQPVSSFQNVVSPQDLTKMSMSPPEQTNGNIRNNNANMYPLTVSNSAPVNNGVSKMNNPKATKMQTDLAKYQQLVSLLIPDLPPLSTLDVPTFAQIVQNFKGNSPNYLEDAVKEYHMISKDTVSPTNYQSPWLASPELMNKNQYASSTNSVDSMFDNGDNQRSSSVLSPSLGREIKIMLPPKNIALQFVKNTWKYCCVLLRFYHRPLFIEQLNELYDTEPNNYTQKQMQFLPLCYSIMAVGALFSKSLSGNDDGKTRDSESNTTDSLENKFLQDEGYKYFIAARKLIDITNTRDLNSIQTVVMLFIFLQCSARLSTCYAYIGVAMRSVLREGYHRLTPENSGLNPIEIEVRKRLFYTIYKLDVYVNAMLGLPRSISTDDFDQVLPIELSDENITAEGYFPDNQNGVLSSVAISNHHTKLIMILNDIVKDLYPIKKTSNIISHETVTNLEERLKEWTEQLPPEMQPSGKNISQKYERANKLLHLSFLHVQIILYRPFIHYVSHKYSSSSPDALSVQRARHCISVSRAVVTLAQDMLNKSLITGSYWYASYTIFYSVAGLLFYTHEAEPYDKESAREYYDILKDAEIGRNLLMKLKDTSMAANRTYNILNKLFEKLNTRTIQLLNPWEGRTAQTLTSNFPSESSDSSSTHKFNGSEKNVSQNQDPFPVTSNGNSVTKRESSTNPPVTNVDLQSNPMNSTNDSMSSVFNFNSTANDQLANPSAGNMTNPISGQNVDPAGQAAVINSTAPTSIKFANGENNDSLGVLNVFDQLDAQLFGKYTNDNNFENTC